MISRPPQITDRHIRRKALVYIRQSSPQQVRDATGSAAVQRDLVFKLNAWGWDRSMIEEVDADLGTSGSWAGTRDAFNQMLERMRADEIGIVADVDSSRLSRNDADFFMFAEVARRYGVLLAHGDQIIDFADPNSAFIGGILGLNATRENRVRIQLSVQARRKKAEAGIAPTTPPIGYVRRPGGAWDKDPDPRVREIISLVFDTFLEIGSIRGVVRHLRTRKIQVPRRRWHDRAPWQDAVYDHITGFLKNPVYAGRYIFGRTVQEPPPEGSRRRGRQRPQPSTTWTVIDHHHEPYVDPARWEQIQQQIAANRRAVRPPAGRGEALVQGLLECTLHRTTLMTVYSGRYAHPDGRVARPASYVCRPDRPGADPCTHVSVRARLIDTVVERALQETLAPVALDGIQEAARQELRQHEALQRGRQDELRRAEQAIAEAERTYLQADPANVRFRQRLGDRAEQAVRNLDVLRARHRDYPLVAPVTLDEQTIVQIRQLLQDLPRLWRQPSVTPEQRKSIARLAIRRIHVTPGPGTWPIEIQWETGSRTRLELTPEDRKPVRLTRRERPRSPSRTITPRSRVINPQSRAIEPQAYLFIRDRLAEGLSRPAIAEALNAACMHHPRGAWRLKNVDRAIERLRQRRVPGVEPLPAPPALTERVQALYDRGCSPSEIVAQLRAQQVETRHRTLVTRWAVEKALERLGLSTHAALTNAQVHAHLRAESPSATAAEIANRLNSLGFKTIRERPWTPESVREKCRALGLQFARIPHTQRASKTSRTGQAWPVGLPKETE